MIKHILKTSIKDFANNKILTIINMTSIVLALILITMASSWIYLSLSPIPPAEEAKSFYSIRAVDQSGHWQSVTITDCETINKTMKDGLVWYYGSAFSLVSVNRNNRKMDYRIGSSDVNFWKALNFKFIKGGPFSEAQFTNREYVVIVSDRFASAYFGSTDAFGKYFIYGKLSFKVVGVFKSINTTSEFIFDIYIPHSLIPENAGRHVNPYFLSNNSHGISDLKIFLEKYKSTDGKDSIQLYATPYLGSLFDLKNSYKYWGVLVISFLLPILCFSNMFSRKMELKTPEMAIKRAFGATRRDIFLNLVVENVFYVGIAGIIALLIAHPLIGFAFNPTGSENIDTDFLFLKFYLSTILLYLVFGVVSAFHPAWKVSGKSIISNI
jgi:putative ABC transport system permease protein